MLNEGSEAYIHSFSLFILFFIFQCVAGRSTVWNCSPFDLCIVITCTPAIFPQGTDTLWSESSHAVRNAFRSADVLREKFCTSSKKAIT